MTPFYANAANSANAVATKPGWREATRALEAEPEPEPEPPPDAKERGIAIPIMIPYTPSADPEEHRKQREHILACVAQAAAETVQSGLDAEETEAKAEPRNINITVSGNFFPDRKTGKVRVLDKTA